MLHAAAQRNIVAKALFSSPSLRQSGMTAHHIPLQNASNLRDLGGWPTRDGRRVRTGLVFRAPALVGLSGPDEQTIATLGLRTICDFRGTRERAHSPVTLPGATNLSLPIEPSVGAGLKDILRTGQASGHVTPDEMLDLLREAYQAYALQSSAQYRALFAQILQEESLPLLLHCTAGKDRTGFGAALLLTSLGVAWEHVLEDYLATNQFWRRETARGLDLAPAVAETLLSAHAALLEATFAAIRQEYGSVDAYLTQAIGLDGSARARLEERLLDTAEARPSIL
jgi:protein-tyrosine phosphatase